jgi:glutamyl/glutaminyl-tRNA synthetase
VLRIEDTDFDRSSEAMGRHCWGLSWLGLIWDGTFFQSNDFLLPAAGGGLSQRRAYRCFVRAVRPVDEEEEQPRERP